MLERPISPVPLVNQQVLNPQPGVMNNTVQIPSQNINVNMSMNARPLTPNGVNFVRQ
jgi:hypothetical protein